MKTRKFLSFTVIALLAILFVGFTSCSKDSEPSENDLFIGTYKGKVSYTKNAALLVPDIKNDNGQVVVTKVGDNYSFLFSDKIPDLTNVKFEKEGDSWVGVSSTMSGAITINANHLTIAVVKDGHGWTADAKR